MSGNDWKIGKVESDPFNIMSCGMADADIVEVENLETGEKRSVAIWSDSEEGLEEQVGRAISEGNFLP